MMRGKCSQLICQLSTYLTLPDAMIIERRAVLEIIVASRPSEELIDIMVKE